MSARALDCVFRLPLTLEGACRVCRAPQTRALHGTEWRKWLCSSLQTLAAHLKIPSASLSSQVQPADPDAGSLPRALGGGLGTRLVHRYSSQVSSSDPDTAPKPAGHPWRIVAAVCVQRFPTLSRENLELELQYEALKDTMREEWSRLSDFELEELEHKKKKRERERRALEEDLDEKQVARMEGTDEFEELQEAREAELQSFQPASRETEADRTNDLKCLERRLDNILYLLVKKPRKEHSWQMPQGGLEEGETLLQAGRRELEEECGSELQVEFLSGAPSAFFSYKHSSPSLPGIVGSKVFFLKAQYRGGQVQLDNREVEDCVWVTREEMKNYVAPNYYAAVAPILTD